MNALKGFSPGFGAWERVERNVFLVIWILFAALYGLMAFQARGALDVKLAKAGFRIPVSRQSQLGGLRWEELINQLAENQDKTAAILEQSIRSSARTTLMVNLSCVCISLLCLATQCRRGNTRVPMHVRPLEKLPRDAAPPPSQVRPGGADGRVLEMAHSHDGSFPEGGYDR